MWESIFIALGPYDIFLTFSGIEKEINVAGSLTLISNKYIDKLFHHDLLSALTY